MIAKSLLLLSIFFNTFGIGSMSNKFDDAYINNLNQVSAKSAQASDLDLYLPTISARPYVKPNAPEATAFAKRYLLADLDSGLILAKDNEHEKVPIASTTKIMTASIVLENYKLDDVVTISADAVAETGASIDFQVNEKMTVYNLLKCMLIKSANGAAYALAEHMNQGNETGVSTFMGKMNQKAKALGMNDTDYHDPAGLDVTGYSSAYDLLTVTKYALQKPTFAEIVQTKSATVTDVTGRISLDLQNSNRLVSDWNYFGAIGVKTGYMPEAGHCLVGAAKRDGHTLVSIVLETDSVAPTASAQESQRLLDWGWQNIVWQS